MNRLLTAFLWAVTTVVCMAQDAPRTSVDVLTDGSAAAERIVAAVTRQWPEAALLRGDAATQSTRPGGVLRRQLVIGEATQPVRAVALPKVHLRLRDSMQILRERARTLWPQRRCVEITRGATLGSALALIAACSNDAILLFEEGALSSMDFDSVLRKAKLAGMTVGGTLPQLRELGAALVVHADPERAATAVVAALRLGNSVELEDHTSLCTGILSELQRSGARLSAAILGGMDVLLPGGAR
ncbi:MAG: hypothetical protein EXS14_04985 [Planctomycetes bacterium]|nr:hypothetical protein [Planctomycetota bacterium]